MKQKQTSAIRRLDSLGRIVLPKEVRQKFHLSQGCEVLVETQNDKIVISATNKISSLENILPKIVQCFGSDFKVLICGESQILASNFKVFDEEKLFDILKKKENQIFCGNEPKLFEKQKSVMIFPIFSQGSYFGSLVVGSFRFVQNFDFVKPLKRFLELCLEN